MFKKVFKNPLKASGSDPHVIRMLSSHGDDVVATWDPADAASVKTAEDVFNQLVGGGYLPFTAVVDAVPEGPIRRFDPAVKEYVVSRPFVGG